jgi:hypothetical protein
MWLWQWHNVQMRPVFKRYIIQNLELRVRVGGNSGSSRKNQFAIGLFMLNLTAEEIVQYRAQDNDCGEFSDFIPGGNHDGTQNIGSEREFKPEGQPSSQRKTNIREFC